MKTKTFMALFTILSGCDSGPSIYQIERENFMKSCESIKPHYECYLIFEGRHKPANCFNNQNHAGSSFVAGAVGGYVGSKIGGKK